MAEKKEKYVYDENTERFPQGFLEGLSKMDIINFPSGRVEVVSELELPKGFLTLRRDGRGIIRVGYEFLEKGAESGCAYFKRSEGNPKYPTEEGYEVLLKQFWEAGL